MPTQAEIDAINQAAAVSTGRGGVPPPVVPVIDEAAKFRQLGILRNNIDKLKSLINSLPVSARPPYLKQLELLQQQLVALGFPRTDYGYVVNPTTPEHFKKNEIFINAVNKGLLPASALPKTQQPTDQTQGQPDKMIFIYVGIAALALLLIFKKKKK